jgi:hypothetical protein
MNIDNKVRFDKRSTVPGVGGWSIEGLKLNDVRIKSARGRYLAMKTNGALYMDKSKKIPDANAWKLVCTRGDIITASLTVVPAAAAVGVSRGDEHGTQSTF